MAVVSVLCVVECVVSVEQSRPRRVNIRISVLEDVCTRAHWEDTRTRNKGLSMPLAQVTKPTLWEYLFANWETMF